MAEVSTIFSSYGNSVIITFPVFIFRLWCTTPTGASYQSRFTSVAATPGLQLRRAPPPSPTQQHPPLATAEPASGAPSTAADDPTPTARQPRLQSVSSSSTPAGSCQSRHTAGGPATPTPKQIGNNRTVGRGGE